MKICSIIDCENPLLARSYCNKHYLKWKRHGVATFVFQSGTKICSKPNCNERHSSLGYCKKHYSQFRSQNGLIPKRIYHFRTNNHEICEKLGKRGANLHYDEYPFKCAKCNVSYNKKSEQFFFHKIYCPCCHKPVRRTQVRSKHKRGVIRIEDS